MLYLNYQVTSYPLAYHKFRIYCLEQRFPTYLRSRITWAPPIVNAYHRFQNN